MFNSTATNVEAIVAAIVTRIDQLPKLSTQPIRALRRQFSRHLAKAEPGIVIEIARQLLARNRFEYRFVAYELISHHKQALRSLRKKQLLRLANGLESWVAGGTFALYLAGPCWREGRVPDTLIEPWARSKDRWWRRTALVCTVALNSKARGGSGDTKRT